MKQEREFDPIGATAANLGLGNAQVRNIVEEFLLQLHRDLVEYEGLNGDYLGESLPHYLPPQAYFHLLGFLDRFSERYQWEAGTAHEYLARLGTRDEWLPYLHQSKGWVESSHYKRRPQPTKPSEGAA